MSRQQRSRTSASHCPTSSTNMSPNIGNLGDVVRLLVCRTWISRCGFTKGTFVLYCLCACVVFAEHTYIYIYIYCKRWFHQGHSCATCWFSHPKRNYYIYRFMQWSLLSNQEKRHGGRLTHTKILVESASPNV